MNKNAEQELVARILRPDIADDPEAFVMYAFPWGKRGDAAGKTYGAEGLAAAGVGCAAGVYCGHADA